MSTTPHRHEAPPANKGLLALAVVLLAIPIVALLLVGTYAKDEPPSRRLPLLHLVPVPLGGPLLGADLHRLPDRAQGTSARADEPRG